MRNVAHFIALLPLVLNTPAFAQQIIGTAIGTGFVINTQGNVVTNAHVVEKCTSVSIITATGEEKAQVVAINRSDDLAVLKTSYISAYNAQLHPNIEDLTLGESVAVMGYPGYAKGRDVFRKSTVINLKGRSSFGRHIELTNTSAPGNSGSPVLDSSGRVVAIIKATAHFYRTDATRADETQLAKVSDIAVSLDALKQLLTASRIPFYVAYRGDKLLDDAALYAHAKQFIVPVRCTVERAHPSMF